MRADSTSCLASGRDTKSNTVLQTLRKLSIFNDHVPRQPPIIVFALHTNTTCIYGHPDCPGHYRWQPPSAWTNNQLQQFVFEPNAAPERLHQTQDSPSIASDSFSQTQRPSTIVPAAQPIQPPPISTPARLQQPIIAPVYPYESQVPSSIVNSDSQQAQDAPVVPVTAPQWRSTRQRRRRSTSTPTPLTRRLRILAPAPSAPPRNDSPVGEPPTAPPEQQPQPTPQTNMSALSNDTLPVGYGLLRPCKWCVRYHTTCDHVTPTCGPCVARRDLVECVYTIWQKPPYQRTACALCKRTKLKCDKRDPCRTCLERKENLEREGCVYTGR